MTVMTVIGYIREPQAGQDCTIDEQRAAIESYCQANALELTCFVEDSADQSSIGLLYRSYGFQLQAAENTHIVFAAYRRSFSTYNDFVVSEKTLVGHQNTLHLLDWHARSDQPAWAVLLHILEEVSHRQLEYRAEPKIRFRVLGQQHKRRRVCQGRLWSINADVPLFYSRVLRDDRKLPDLGTHLKINRRENNVLSLLAEMRRKGFTDQKIAHTFNKVKMPVPRHPGAKWCPSCVRDFYTKYLEFQKGYDKMQRYFKPSRPPR